MSENAVTYEAFKELLEDKYGKKRKYLFFNSRMDCLFAPQTDYTFLIKESDRSNVEYLQKTIKNLKGKQGHFPIRDYALLAECYAIGGEYTGSLKVDSDELFRIMLFEAGAGDVTQSAVIADHVNYGKTAAADAISQNNLKEMGKVINTTLGRQITEWKLSYNREYEYNTEDRMNTRFVLGLNALRILEFISKHPDCVNAITKKKLERARIMAEKAKMILDAYVTENELHRHGVAVEYRMPEVDTETGNVYPGKCIYTDGFAYTENEFCQMQLNRILPYLRENSPDRDFSGFEIRVGKFDMMAIRALYERAGRECFDIYYAKETDEAKRKEMFELLKSPDKTARLVEQRAVYIANMGIQKYIKENYMSFGKHLKRIVHKVNGQYDKNIRAAQVYIQLNGGEIPDSTWTAGNGESKKTVKMIVAEYREPVINNRMLGWPVGKGAPVSFESETEKDPNRVTADEAVKAYKQKLSGSK